jgi:hypothetical protein
VSRGKEQEERGERGEMHTKDGAKDEASKFGAAKTTVLEYIIKQSRRRVSPATWSQQSALNEKQSRRNYAKGGCRHGG